MSGWHHLRDHCVTGPLDDADLNKCGLIDYTSPYLRTARCSSLWLGALCHRKGNILMSIS